ncbi:hypothetical protein IKF88_00925 [Candidatus Saccharibacteria bacterium]|nr:hypothetical protein [Candidatus Saccharibacteria bacterium]
MQLVAILLITVSILTLLSGIAVFFGASKGDRARSAWFFMATVFATVWMVSISIFLIAKPEWYDIMPRHVNWTYISSIFIDVALLGYISWRYKAGKIATITFLALGLFLTGFFVHDPSLLYTDIVLANTGNSLVTNIGPFYFIYIAFYCLLVPTIIITLLCQILKSTSKRIRGGDLVLLIGFAISGTMSLIFNLILPLWTWNLVWLGPLAVSTTIIAFYYTILRFRALNLSSRWLKVLSYIVIITSSAVIYMVIFYVIFAAMFRGSTPSVEVIVLNFVMILIVLLLTPAMSELNMFVRSLISNQQIDMVYIIKKLSKVNLSSNTDLRELATFLAEHMHFEYIGIMIDDQIYGSAPRRFSADGIKLIDSLGEPEQGVWQEFDESSEVWQKLDLSAIAALRTSGGKTFGQVMVGKPLSKTSFTRQDLVQVETIINLVAVIIDSGSRRKAK